MTGRARSAAILSGDAEGQGLVEFAMVVPVFLLFLVGMLEFGFLFDQAMTLNYATREGARSGAAFATGNSNMPSADVDANVIAAVQRVLDSPGSRVTKADVTGVRIYQATATGTDAGVGQSWIYDRGRPVVGGEPPLDFRNASGNWTASGRDNTWTNGAPPRVDRREHHLQLSVRHPARRDHGLLRRAGPGHVHDQRPDGHGPQPHQPVTAGCTQ